MHWTDRYLSCPYEAGARGPHAYDCWGQAREVLMQGYGWPELPAFGPVRETDPAAMQAAEAQLLPWLRVCAHGDGALAAAYRGGVLAHVGVVVAVDGRLMVLHTTSKRGPRRDPLRVFERAYFDVRYYRVR